MHGEHVGYCLCCLGAALRAVGGEALAVKDAAYASVSLGLPAVLVYLQVYAGTATVMQAVVDFLLAAVKSIRKQVRPSA
jgi:ABC-type arginine transport system permease subunit